MICYDLNMNRKVHFAVGEYYHVYNRGVEKRDVFLEQADYGRFLKSLFIANSSKSILSRFAKGKELSEINREEVLTSIGVYCLMPNHFHLLLKEVAEGGISNFMSKLTTSYAKYFNTKYERVGPLFQSRFKAEHISRDEHLKYLFAYIHLNPVSLIDPKWKEDGVRDIEKAKNYIANYKYSSYQDYINLQREERLILTKKSFPEYFTSSPIFESFIEDWLAFELI